MTYRNPYDKDTPLQEAWNSGAANVRTGRHIANPYGATDNIEAFNAGEAAQRENGPVNPYSADTDEFPARGRSFWEQGFETVFSLAEGTDMHTAREHSSGYAADQNVKAWQEGFDVGIVTLEAQDNEDIENEEPPFDPSTIDLTEDGVVLAFGKLNIKGTLTRFLYPIWVGSHEGRPAWLSETAQDRRVYELSQSLVRSIVRQSQSDMQTGDFELPCPPYDFSSDGDQLTITGGPFTKSGSKEDWQNVIDEFQTQLDEMPDGIDLYGVTFTAKTTVTVEVEHEVDPVELLNYHDQLDGTMFMGDVDELMNALSEHEAEAGETVEDVEQHTYSIESTGGTDFSRSDVESSLNN